MYIYRAKCVRVIDGDTVDLYVDMGLKMYSYIRFRLLGIDTYELNAKLEEERSLAARAKIRLTELLGLSTVSLNDPWPLIIATEKADSFGRWLCSISVGDVDVATTLLNEGLAVPYVR